MNWLGSKQALDCVPYLFGFQALLVIVGGIIHIRLCILRARLESLRQKERQ
jgi:hypothetical protein